MTINMDTRAEAARLAQLFYAAGAQPVDTDILLPADTLLDLYGEDIRARAYVTDDPMDGEMMLRPDFTVPVVQQHMENGAAPARYTYAGEVFRKQDGSARAREYLQVGYELFEDQDTANADAEVFSLFSQILTGLPVAPIIGDIGILTAAVQGLTTLEARKRALMRHIWRPKRFRALLDRFSRPGAARQDVTQDGDIPFIGLRSHAEIEARLDILRQDAQTPPIIAGEVTVIQDILSIKENAPNALERLRDLQVDLPAIEAAVDGLARRLDVLQTAGCDVDNMQFEGSFGRSLMEYYDGFVFGFMATGQPGWPPIASGGRYDALTRVLGRGAVLPAVGGILRPGLTLALRENVK
jgi:ATP phosphoribosyltransferase regulatory subunit